MHFGYHAIFPNMADEMNQVWKKRTTNFDSIEKMTGKKPWLALSPQIWTIMCVFSSLTCHTYYIYNTKVTSVWV